MQLLCLDSMDGCYFLFMFSVLLLIEYTDIDINN